MRPTEKTFHFRRKSESPAGGAAKLPARSDSEQRSCGVQNENRAVVVAGEAAATSVCAEPCAGDKSSVGIQKRHGEQQSTGVVRGLEAVASANGLLCERIPRDIAQEVRLLRLCEWFALASLDGFRQRLVASQDLYQKTAGLECVSENELCCCIALFEGAVSTFLKDIEERFVTPNRLLTSAPPDTPESEERPRLEELTFADVNRLLQRPMRPNKHNQRMRKSLSALTALEALYDREIAGWEDVQNFLHDENQEDMESDEACALSPVDSTQTDQALHDIRDHQKRLEENILLHLDQLERHLQRLFLRYQAADEFCLSTARRINSDAFAGLVDIGETRKLLANAPSAVWLEQAEA